MFNSQVKTNGKSPKNKKQPQQQQPATAPIKTEPVEQPEIQQQEQVQPPQQQEPQQQVPVQQQHPVPHQHPPQGYPAPPHVPQQPQGKELFIVCPFRRLYKSFDLAFLALGSLKSEPIDAEFEYQSLQVNPPKKRKVETRNQYQISFVGATFNNCKFYFN